MRQSNCLLFVKRRPLGIFVSAGPRGHPWYFALMMHEAGLLLVVFVFNFWPNGERERGAGAMGWRTVRC